MYDPTVSHKTLTKVNIYFRRTSLRSAMHRYDKGATRSIRDKDPKTHLLRPSAAGRGDVTARTHRQTTQELTTSGGRRLRHSRRRLSSVDHLHRTGSMQQREVQTSSKKGLGDAHAD